MWDCKTNSFCRSLLQNTREKLCTHCSKMLLPDTTSFPVDADYVFLVLSGVIHSSLDNKPTCLLVPGNMVLNPTFSEITPEKTKFSAEYTMSRFFSYSYSCVTPVVYAYFPTEEIRALLQDIDFVNKLLLNNLQIQTQKSLYLSALYQGSAYEAVRFILAFCQSHELPSLTHAQIARLVGKNRSTVTQVIHEIAQKDPSLLQSYDSGC